MVMTVTGRSALLAAPDTSIFMGFCLASNRPADIGKDDLPVILRTEKKLTVKKS
jgi:hypothetical protein